MSNLPDGALSGLLAYWNSLTFDQREELTRNLETFTALVASLKARGIVDCDMGMSTIQILEPAPELKELRALLKKLGPKGVKLIERGEVNGA